MSGPSISRETSARLASFVERRRSELVDAVSRSSALLRSQAADAIVFAHEFFDRLCQELEIGDRDALDVWIDAGSEFDGAGERARMVVVACAIVSTSYAIECGREDDVVSYLAVRAGELERRVHAARHVRKRSSDPSAFVSRDEVVASFLSALEARDGATCDHSRAVGMWCGRIAKMLGLSLEDQALAVLAGTLHDIGKISTPSEILGKAGPLSSDEWETMRAHALIGAKMLERIPSMHEVAPIVRAHHERVDGTGYPDNVAGEAIPLLARIVAVADSFHAMISKRPYRQPLSVPRAIDELRAGSGTQWDATIVETMLSIVQPSSNRHRAPLRAVRGGASG